MSLELDDETLAALGWGSDASDSTQSYANESPATVKARVYAWRAAHPGWWLTDAHRARSAASMKRLRKAARRAASAKAGHETSKGATTPLARNSDAAGAS